MRFQLRTEPSQRALRGAVLLDYFSGRASTVRHNTSEFFNGLVATPASRDLFHLGLAVYCADRVARRATTADGWTRDIDLVVPVQRREWRAATNDLTEALRFLTGDRWTLHFVAETLEPAVTNGQLNLMPGDAICLFSGGLDSLIGAIDLLENGKTVVLVGHFESGLAPKRQSELADGLKAHYGRDRVELRRLRLGPNSASPSQKSPLPPDRENTTRGRSFLFLAAGFAIAQALGHDAPLFIPENGFIGINVPLTGSRPASLSTRTTHPYFVELVARICATVGINSTLENPYRLMTKGEMLSASRNGELLRRLAKRSLSCAHPEAARWTKAPRRPQGNCGYCYPCLIRQASLYRAKLSGGPYAYDVHRDYQLIAATSKGASLRALLRSLSSPASPAHVLRTGPIPNGDAADFGDVYLRGRKELLSWLKAKGGPEVRRRLV